MGWWCVAPGKWLLFYDHPKRPGARWVPDDDPSIGWKKPKPIYLSHTVDEHKLATDIAVHGIDLAQWICGCRVKSVTGARAWSTGRAPNIQVRFRLEKGSFVSIHLFTD